MATMEEATAIITVKTQGPLSSQPGRAFDQRALRAAVAAGEILPVRQARHNTKEPYPRRVKLRDGRMLSFLTRTCRLTAGFPFANPDHLQPFQRANLIAAGRAGAIAGILVEAKGGSLDIVFWIPWEPLLDDAYRIEWTDERLLFVGSAEDRSIDLSLITKPQEVSRG